MSEATIYEYFNSKEELLFSIPSEVAVQHLTKSEETVQYVQGAANKIRVLIYRSPMTSPKTFSKGFCFSPERGCSQYSCDGRNKKPGRASR